MYKLKDIKKYVELREGKDYYPEMTVDELVVGELKWLIEAIECLRIFYRASCICGLQCCSGYDCEYCRIKKIAKEKGFIE